MTVALRLTNLHKTSSRDVLSSPNLQFFCSVSVGTTSANAEMRRSRMLNFLISKEESREATHGSVQTQHGDAASITRHQQFGNSNKQSEKNFHFETVLTEDFFSIKLCNTVFNVLVEFGRNILTSKKKTIIEYAMI